MFEDQRIELLPARTTMKQGYPTVINQSFNTVTAVALNAGNINVGRDQLNAAAAVAAAGSNFNFLG
jgi:hypothetical protein